MKLPYYNKLWDTTEFTASFVGDIGENGAPSIVGTYSGKGRYSERVITNRSPDGQFVRYTASSLTIAGDVSAGLESLKGSVTIGGVERLISSSSRPRNPDGTVHHTRLELV